MSNCATSKLFTRVTLHDMPWEALVYQIIGHSELSTIKLPGSREQPSDVGHVEQLFLRMGRILESVHTLLIKKSDESGTVSPESLLRIIGYICDLASSPLSSSSSAVDCAIRRRCTLNVLVRTTRIAELSNTIWSLEQSTWVQNQVKDMVREWSIHAPLSAVEEVIANAVIIPSLHFRSEVFQTNPSPSTHHLPTTTGEASAVLEILLNLSGCDLSGPVREFWVLYDWNSVLMSEEWAPTARTFYRDAMIKLQFRADYIELLSLPIYLLEDLAVRIGLAYQQCPDEDAISSGFTSSMMCALIKKVDALHTKCLPQRIVLSDWKEPVVQTQARTSATNGIAHELQSVTPDVQNGPKVRTMSLPAPSGLSLSPVAQNIAARRDSKDIGCLPSRKPLPVAFNPPPEPVKLAPPQDAQSNVSALTTQITIQAYEYPLPVELPASISPTNVQSPRTQSVVYESGLEISPHHTPHDLEKGTPLYEPGLELANTYKFDPAADYSKIFVSKSDAQSIRTFSSAGSISSPTRSGLFGRFGGSKKPSLPTSLDFCFSSCAQDIWLWQKKDGESLVRMRQPFTTGEYFSIQRPNGLGFAPNKVPKQSIRYVSATPDRVVAVVHIDESRWLYILQGNAFQPLLELDRSIPAVLAFTLSPDGSNIALGCGNFTLAYKLLPNGLGHPSRLNSMADMESRVIRIQKLSFSVDSKRLVSAIQLEHSTQQHAVYICTWTCLDTGFRLEARLTRVLLTVGYPNDSGITAVALVGAHQVFLTAALTKSYHSILSVTPGIRNQYLQVSNKRIDSASQCLLSSHACIVQSGNIISSVDGRIGTATKVADLSTARKGLHHHDHMKIAVPDSATVLAIWKMRDEKLVLNTSILDRSLKWRSSTAELGAIYRQAAGLL